MGTASQALHLHTDGELPQEPINDGDTNIQNFNRNLSSKQKDEKIVIVVASKSKKTEIVQSNESVNMSLVDFMRAMDGLKKKKHHDHLGKQTNDASKKKSKGNGKK